LLITIVGLVVGRGGVVISRGMVDNLGRGIGWGMVDNSMMNWGMDSMVNNRGSMNCMMYSRSSMVD